MKHIVLAPISKNNPEAKRNHEHELFESENFRPVMWHGEVNGKDQVGDYFGFVDREKNEIRVHEVIQILGSSAGRRHWTGNSSMRACGKKAKNVLVMNPTCITIKLSMFIEAGVEKFGYNPKFNLPGTQRRKFPY